MRTLLILSALLSHFWLFSQNRPSQCPCCTPQHEQFDFWIGEWEVSDTSGTIVGYNTITKEQNNCVLKESWRSAKGKFTGTSFNYYDSQTKTWNQLWIDNAGSQLNLQGGFQGKNMVLESQPFTDKSGKEKQHQITWTPNEDGSVRQVWIVTNLEDGIVNTLFNGLYTPKN
jgi:hypothetical protein